MLASLLVCQSVGQSVHYKVVLKAFYCIFYVSSEKKLGQVNNRFLSVFEKKNSCPSVCLAFFESADTRDLGLMSLLHYYSNPNTWVSFLCHCPCPPACDFCSCVYNLVFFQALPTRVRGLLVWSLLFGQRPRRGR